MRETSPDAKLGPAVLVPVRAGLVGVPLKACGATGLPVFFSWLNVTYVFVSDIIFRLRHV
jgi:hypothetical protein